MTKKQKDDGYNLMIGPLQPCEAMLGLFIDIEKKYNIEFTDSEANELWEYWIGDKYELNWNRSYIQSYYDSIKESGPKFESWRRWCRRWLRDYDRKNKESIYTKIKRYVKL